MKNYSSEFKKQAARLLPQHEELISLVEELELSVGTANVTPDLTEDHIVRGMGEYLGGMAVAIRAMIEANAYRIEEGE